MGLATNCMWRTLVLAGSATTRWGGRRGSCKALKSRATNFTATVDGRRSGTEWKRAGSAGGRQRAIVSAMEGVKATLECVTGCTVDLTFTQKRFLLRAFDGRLERLSERLAQRLA